MRKLLAVAIALVCIAMISISGIFALSEFGGDCEPLFLTTGDGGVSGVAPLMRRDGCLTFIGDAAI